LFYFKKKKKKKQKKKKEEKKEEKKRKKRLNIKTIKTIKQFKRFKRFKRLKRLKRLKLISFDLPLSFKRWANQGDIMPVSLSLFKYTSGLKNWGKKVSKAIKEK
jgi:peroxiredoxin